ncbi:MAG TPA: alpha/beta hydrolase fold domain-containing protein [Stellaceae bacterium]|nr:alpha/beta hydrolase fold domain-containing protein [Stellaceae bacterium]
MKRTTRRAALAGIAVAALAGKASAQGQRAPAHEKWQPGPPPHTKGNRVFLDYDQVELDAAFNQSFYAANIEETLARFASNSELVRARLGAPMRESYGIGELEKIDVYATKKRDAPIHVFIHGGDWRGGAAKDYAFPAEVFVAAGAHFAVADFASMQATNGSLAPLVDQIRHVIGWLYRNAPRFGGDRNGIYLSGHSSGGHLAAVALTTEWSNYGAPTDVIKGGLCISGIYDLKPVRLSSRSAYLKIDEPMQEALSPIRHIDKLRTPLLVAYGSDESPEFQRQGKEFAAAIKATSRPVELLAGQHYNHFELLETLANPYGLLGRAALQQMKLT